ncbi:MAG: dienelactone hydrolase family protein [Acidobacteriota bacterium]
MPEHVHGGEPLRVGPGPDLASASAAMVLVHGRGATAMSILTLAEAMPKPGMAYIAPQASGQTWYPHSFLARRGQNEPGLSSGLRRLEETVGAVLDAGIESDRIVLLGFSQGACLTLDYAARHPRRYAAVVAFTGGLIGPRDQGWDRLEPGLDGTPIFLGCSDQDPHVPLRRVQESGAVLRRLGGDVETRIYPGMPHTIIDDEVQWVRDLLDGLP